MSNQKHILLLSVTSNFSLLPLLFTADLLLLKLSFLLLNFLLTAYNVKQPLHTFECIYLLGFMGVFSYESIWQYAFRLDKRLPFLPLLLCSCYCSLGIIYFWISSYVIYMKKNVLKPKIK